MIFVKNIIVEKFLYYWPHSRTTAIFSWTVKHEIWTVNLEQRNIIIAEGRSVPTIHHEPNPWYIPDAHINADDLMGDYYYDEDDLWKITKYQILYFKIF